MYVGMHVCVPFNGALYCWFTGVHIGVCICMYVRHVCMHACYVRNSECLRSQHVKSRCQRIHAVKPSLYMYAMHECTAVLCMYVMYVLYVCYVCMHSCVVYVIFL
jgi:hypothetical protein